MSLKDILEENRKVLAAWPQWKKEIASLKTRLAACEADKVKAKP